MEGSKLQTSVQMKGIKKYFPGTRALDWEAEQTLEFRTGEIHGLVGENGAGKSTLFQILMGIYDRTAGTMSLFGEDYNPKNSGDAEAAGISIIMQQPNFAFNLTVAENIFLGRDAQFAKGGVIDWKKQNAAAAEVLAKCHYDHIKPTAVVGQLNFEERKQVEIARALSVNPRVLLVDETSAAVSKESVDSLYDLLREQRDKGVTVIYISHFIDEVYQLCDRVSVLRDGHLISTDNIELLSPEMIINKMVGRDISSASYRDDSVGEVGEVVFELKKFSSEPNFRNVDLEIHAGEIVGMAGIGGCGSDHIARCIFGYETPTGGEMIFKGRNAYSKSPLDAIKHHIGYIPKDRDKEGLFLGYDAIWNISSANLLNTSKNGFVQSKVDRKAAEDAVAEYRIKIPNVETHIGDLSGGNRQKVVIAKWIKNNSELLLVCSPTRGVDVGAKYEIYKFLDAQRIAGKSVLLISDELPELIGMSDRIFTLKNGEITGEFARKDGFTEESIMAKMV